MEAAKRCWGCPPPHISLRTSEPGAAQLLLSVTGRRTQDPAMAWQRLGDLCCATLGSSVPLYPTMVKPRIPVPPQPAQGCAPRNHAPPRVLHISPEGASRHMPPPQQISAGHHSPKYPSGEGNIRCTGAAVCPTAGQQRRLSNTLTPVGFQTRLSPRTPVREPVPPCPVRLAEEPRKPFYQTTRKSLRLVGLMVVVDAIHQEKLGLRHRRCS